MHAVPRILLPVPMKNILLKLSLGAAALAQPCLLGLTAATATAPAARVDAYTCATPPVTPAKSGKTEKAKTKKQSKKSKAGKRSGKSSKPTSAPTDSLAAAARA